MSSSNKIFGLLGTFMSACLVNNSGMTADLIKKHTGSVEKHEITTEDGYILSLFRIPRQNAKGTLLLQHPLAVNARVWVGQGNDSLAFFLWQQGYDVWLGNQRGTIFSNTHVNMSSADYSYWDFSFHEVGVYDISAQLNFIKASVKSDIILIGHSMGTTSAMIYSTMKPEEAKSNLKAMVLVSTATYFRNNNNPVLMFTSFAPLLRLLSVQLKWGAVYLFFIPFFHQTTRIISRMFPVVLLGVSLWMSMFCGWTPEEIDPAIINFDSAIYLKNISWKVLIHFLQLMDAKTRFPMYDYGKTENLKMYGSEEAPSYPLDKVSVPVLFISSVNDSLTTAKDAQLFSENLPENRRLGHVVVSGLNHADFHIGRHRKEIFFMPLLNSLNDIVNTL